MQYCSGQLARQLDDAVPDGKGLQAPQGQALGCSH